MLFKNTLLISGLASITIISGCSTPIIDIHPSSFSTQDNCDRIDIFHRIGTDQDYIEKIYAEIESRNEFSKEEMRLIRDRSIKVGMREDVMRCSWGAPKRKNTHVSSSGFNQVQYVYDQSFATYYIYVEDGKITSWSKYER